MGVYQLRPMKVEAARVSNLVAQAQLHWGGLPKWFRDAFEAGNVSLTNGYIGVNTTSGIINAEHDYVVVCDSHKYLYVYSSADFKRLYELAPK